ncbi:hypothetical protein [Edaphobacter aggregans]|uniref:hypothetical protein n=1 Tax=Edaphobacter aggregans TaxID=570835 RepID=UPI001B7FF38D|nr:hypothetical protein [Edaphobacter aggregans]
MSTAVATRPISVAKLTEDAKLFEYSKAADPVSSGATPRVPVKVFSADLYASGATRVVPLDLSADLHSPVAATGPSVLANFVRIKANESLTTSPNATSEFYYVIKGAGQTETENGSISWFAGDIFSLPGVAAVHRVPRMRPSTW